MVAMADEDSVSLASWALISEATETDARWPFGVPLATRNGMPWRRLSL